MSPSTSPGSRREWIPRFDRVRRGQALLIALAWIGFVAQFESVADAGGPASAAVVIFIPVGITAWVLGMAGGAWAGLLALPAQFGLLALGGWMDEAIEFGYLVGHLVLLAFAVSIGYLRDLTDRYRVELQLRHAAEAELRRLAATKDDFVAAVSHELRTPVTTILGIVSELRGGAPVSEAEREELLGLVHGGASDLAFIVEDLLVAARTDLGQLAVWPEEVALGPLARSVVAEMAPLGLPGGIVEGVGTAIADPTRVRQVLRNLLSNAMRYGGRTMRVVVGERDGHAFLEVWDDGQGVAAAIAGTLFEPYVSAGRNGDVAAIGLGLDVCRRLAELMDGSVSHERRGGDTVFRLVLPAADPSSSATVHRGAVASGGGGC